MSGTKSLTVTAQSILSLKMFLGLVLPSLLVYTLPVFSTQLVKTEQLAKAQGIAEYDYDICFVGTVLSQNKAFNTNTL